MTKIPISFAFSQFGIKHIFNQIFRLMYDNTLIDDVVFAPT